MNFKLMDIIHDFFVLYSRRSNWYATRNSIRFLKHYYKNKPLVGAEVGVQHGAHSLNILKNLNVKKMYLIDPYTWYDGIDDGKNTKHNSFKQDAHRRMKPYGDKIVFIEKFSHDAITDVKDLLDFVYIDGNHKYDYVKQDLEDYGRVVRIGGVICGHDFDMSDVAHAVTEFASKNGMDVTALGHPCDWWMVKK